MEKNSDGSKKGNWSVRIKYMERHYYLLSRRSAHYYCYFCVLDHVKCPLSTLLKKSIEKQHNTYFGKHTLVHEDAVYMINALQFA